MIQSLQSTVTRSLQCPLGLPFNGKAPEWLDSNVLDATPHFSKGENYDIW